MTALIDTSFPVLERKVDCQILIFFQYLKRRPLNHRLDLFNLSLHSLIYVRTEKTSRCLLSIKCLIWCCYILVENYLDFLLVCLSCSTKYGTVIYKKQMNHSILSWCIGWYWNYPITIEKFLYITSKWWLNMENAYKARI